MSALFDWIYQEPYQTLFSVVPDPSYLRIVGGAVRNTLLHLPITDVDLATRYSPQDITSFFRSKGFAVIPTGLAHGTVTVRVLDQNFEITTLRQDVHTDGRHAVVSFTDSWVHDAHRRDFTINALYLDHKGVVYDDVGGLSDLSKGILRFIGHPNERIQEDYLRILRFYRFWAKYAKTADPESLHACGQWRHGLTRLSKERITSEIMKILDISHPWTSVRAMAEQGVLALILRSNDTPSPSDLLRVTVIQFLEQEWNTPAPALVRLRMLMDSPTQRCPDLMLLSNKQTHFLKTLERPLGTGLDVWSLFYETDLATVRACLWVEAFQAQWNALSSTTNPAKTPLLLPNPQYAKECHDRYVRLPDEKFPPFALSGHDLLSLGVKGAAIGTLLSKVKHRWIQQRGVVNAHQCLADIWAEMAEKNQSVGDPKSPTETCHVADSDSPLG